MTPMSCTLCLLAIVVIYLVIYLFVLKYEYMVYDGSKPIIKIEGGKVQGRRYVTVGRRKNYYAFRGIPYAEPPLEELRFKPPVKKMKWDNIIDATVDVECVQGQDLVQGTEDCLYVSVYTPNAKAIVHASVKRQTLPVSVSCCRNLRHAAVRISTFYTHIQYLQASTSNTKKINGKSLPVMVWIHGGSFSIGNSSYQRPDYILEEDVVFVQFNYRLGVFGFLSTEDLICPGNVGLKDQILAINWVRTNIKYFGGDPKRIVLSGQSAGAVSISYLLQSNLTRGLFQAAIMESGTSLNLWALNKKPKGTAITLAQILGIDITNSSSLIDGLKKVDYRALQKAAYKISGIIFLLNPLSGLQFGPVIEPEHKGAVLTGKSEQELSLGRFHRVPTIIGFNSNEAVTVYEEANYRFYLLETQLYNIFPLKLVPDNLTNKLSSRLRAAFDLQWHYFKFLPIIFQPDSLIKFASDDQFVRPIRRAVLDMSEYAPVYFYIFDYEGSLGVAGQSRSKKGVGHAEELSYIFNYYNFSVPKEDILMRSRMVKLWTNFVKTYNPTPSHDPVLQNIIWPLARKKPGHLSYLSINSSLEIKQDPFKRDMEFWDGIYKKYGEPPYDTY